MLMQERDLHVADERFPTFPRASVSQGLALPTRSAQVCVVGRQESVEHLQRVSY